MKNIKNDTINFQKQNLPFVLNKYVSSSFSVFYTNWHIEPEFIITSAGSETIYIDNQTYVTEPGDIVAIEGGRVHTGSSPMWAHHCLIPSAEFLKSLGISFNDYSFTPFIRSEKLTELFLDIVRESDTEGPFQYAKTVVAAERFLLAFYTEYAKPVEEPENVKAEKNDAHVAVTMKVLNYLRTNFEKDFPIDHIARDIGITTPYMCRCVKLATGMTIVDHLNTIRCNAARHYLLHSKKSIREIASLCGFNGSSYFSKIYKQIMGVSPNDARKEPANG